MSLPTGRRDETSTIEGESVCHQYCINPTADSQLVVYISQNSSPAGKYSLNVSTVANDGVIHQHNFHVRQYETLSDANAAAAVLIDSFAEKLFEDGGSSESIRPAVISDVIESFTEAGWVRSTLGFF